MELTSFPALIWLSVSPSQNRHCAPTASPEGGVAGSRAGGGARENHPPSRSKESSAASVSGLMTVTTSSPPPRGWKYSLPWGEREGGRREEGGGRREGGREGGGRREEGGRREGGRVKPTTRVSWWPHSYRSEAEPSRHVWVEGRIGCVNVALEGGRERGRGGGREGGRSTGKHSK